MVLNTLDYHARLADLYIEEANIAQASSISVRDLKAELKSLGVSTENVLEKGELIARYARSENGDGEAGSIAKPPKGGCCVVS